MHERLQQVFARVVAVTAVLLLSSGVTAFAQPRIDAITAVDVIFSTIGQGQPNVAQGGWAQMWGEGLADGDNNSAVAVNGVTTLSLALSDGRVFFRVPPETELGLARFTATVAGQSAGFDFPVSAFAPAALVESAGGGTFNALDGSLVTGQNPLRPGDLVRIFGLTGLGAVQPPQFRMIVGDQEVSGLGLIDNQPFGQIPALPGVFIFTARVPNLEPGCYPVTLEAGGVGWTSENPDDFAPIGAEGGSESVSCSSQPPGGPQFSSESLLGAAAFGPAASGGLASLFVGLSDFIGDQQSVAESIPLQTVLAATMVEFEPATANGAQQSAPIAAPLVFVSGPAGQINLQIPWEVPPGTASVVVTAGGTASAPVHLEIAKVAPGIFTFDFGAGRAIAFFNDGAIVHPEGTLGLPSRPAAIGEGFSLLVTGLGPTNNSPVTGDNSSAGGMYVERRTVSTPSVTIGGVAAQVFASILSPQFVGVYQVIVVPGAGTPAGDAVPIVIEIDGESSRDDVTVAIASGA